MKFLVFIKRVPDTSLPLRIKGNEIDKEGLTYVINPYDEYGIEEALRWKEKIGGEVVAITVGNANSKDILKNAIAMGVDKAVLIEVENENISPKTIAKLLSEYAKRESFDVIFAGKQSVDKVQGLIPVLVAKYLNIPVVPYIVKFEIQDGKAVVEREVDGNIEKIEVKIPAIFTCEKGLNEPRYPTLKGIMKAKRAQIPVINPNELGVEIKEEEIKKIELKLPPDRPPAKIVESVDELIKLLKEEAKVL